MEDNGDYGHKLQIITCNEWEQSLAYNIAWQQTNKYANHLFENLAASAFAVINNYINAAKITFTWDKYKHALI